MTRRHLRFSRLLSSFLLLLSALLLPACDGGDGESSTGTNFLSAPLTLVGQEFEYTIDAGLDGDPWTINTVKDAPAWLTVVMAGPATIELTGTPPAADMHNVEIDIDGTDNTGNPMHWIYHVHIEIADDIGFDLSGSWSLTVDVTTASGVCAGDENDPPSTDTVAVVQDGVGVELTGVQGSSANLLSGVLYPPRHGSDLAFLVLDGEVEEDGGTTTIHYELDVYSSGGVLHLDGTEDWFWNGSAQSCSGTSTVTAVRLP
ncbi:MAG: hypothetical protein K8J09_03010 [Planctomycetes bacterium]|nr:hypothetical protein [Planctomycetota bacterium]MCC7398218.1 hypothetical protein [Planctomycetota bacterium]